MLASDNIDKVSSNMTVVVGPVIDPSHQLKEVTSFWQGCKFRQETTGQEVRFINLCSQRVRHIAHNTANQLGVWHVWFHFFSLQPVVLFVVRRMSIWPGGQSGSSPCWRWRWWTVDDWQQILSLVSLACLWKYWRSLPPYLTSLP